MTEYKLSRAADRLIGGDEDDVFSGAGSLNTLGGTDVISGGRGTDTLRFIDITTSLFSLGSDRLAGLSSVERIDLSGVNGNISMALDAAAIGQADGGQLTVAFGQNAMTFGISSMDAGDSVVLAGTGQVTLRNFDGQRIQIADGFDGRVTGASSDDVFTGGSGNDTLKGGAGRDTLAGGAGNDVLDGGDGVDFLVSGSGNDTVMGGTGADIFRVGPGSTTITDFDVGFHLERIDLRGVASATDFSKLTVTDSDAGALVAIADTSVLLKGVKADQVSAGNFIYSGQTDTNVISVAAGTAQSVIQRLINESPPGTTIKLEAGVFEFDTTLQIRRTGITLEGAGSDQTIIRSLIPDAKAAPTILVQGSLPEYKFADFTETALKGSKTVTLTTTANLKVGDVLYVAQENDAAFFAETGNTGVHIPDPSDPESAGPLREMLSRVVSIDGNTVTLAEPLPYTFEGGKGWAGKPALLRDVTVGGFRIETNLPTPDSTNFNNTREAWTNVATVFFKSVADSTIHDVSAINNNSSAFVFSRAYNITADHLTALGSHNKGTGGNGYAFVLEEAFASNLTHLTDKDMRHSVLFSTWNAEHYNNIQVDFTNRDINFHGSPDSENTVLVDRSEGYYLPGRASWPTVGPGGFGSPNSTIEANDVRFRYLRSTEKDEIVHAALTGGDIDTAGGDDIIYGARSADLLSGGDGNDLIWGDRGNDRLNGGRGADILRGGANDDVLSGDDGADLLDGEAGIDTLFGGAGNDLLRLGAGDTGTGGAGADTFAITGNATIADFSVADPLEKIDLRGIKAATGFTTLGITQVGADASVVVGGVTILLKNVKASTLTADDFVFVGDRNATLAEMHTKMPNVRPALDSVEYIGTAGNDLIETTAVQITTTARVFGNAGTDTLRVVSDKIGMDAATFARMSSIEIVDVSTATGTIDLEIGAGGVAQANGLLTIYGGADDIGLDTSAVGKAGKVVVETFGTVNLRRNVENVVTVSDRVEGKVVGDSGRDTIFGGARADKLSGGLDDDLIRGGLGNDTLDGGAGDDILDGGLGKDVLIGGEGDDTLRIEGGDIATGGTGSDVFVIGGNATITDYAAADGYEKIDLRGIKEATSFSALAFRQSGADLRVVVGGVTVILKNTSRSAINADDFIFVGSTETTLSDLHNKKAIGTLTSKADKLAGTAGDDIFESTALGLTGADMVTGGAGTDTLRFISGRVSQTDASLGRLSSVEIIDVTSTSGTASFQVGAAAVGQADGDRLTLFGGTKDLFLDTSAVGKAGTVVTETYGTVTLRTSVDNAVTVSDKVGGRVIGGERRDTITGGAQADVLTGAGGDDRIVGGAGNDTLDGGAGDDILDGGLGKDVLTGGDGNDTLLLAGGDTATGGAGSDVFVIGGSAVITDFSVTDGYEKIDLRGIKAATSFSALSLKQVGADLQVKVGTTTFFLKNTSQSKIAADDFIFFGSTESTLAGLHSRPVIGTLTSGADKLVGTAGDDFFESTALGLTTADNVTGGAGTDTLRFISGRVSQTDANLARLSSVEIIDVTQTSGTASFQIGAAAVGQADGDRLTLFGGMKDFFLDTSAVGTAGTVVVETYGTVTLRPVVNNAVTVSDKVEGKVVGGGRVDLITGGAKADSLTGGEGNDVLDGKGGADLLVGGRHDDTYYVDNARDRVVELKMEGKDTLIASVSYTLAAGQEIETLQLAAGRTKLALTGNEFAQTLVGNAGVNILDGKLGHDVLTGGAGADTFVFSTQPGSTNLDHITDFAVEDTIQLAKSVFAALAPGKLLDGAFKDLAVAGAKLDADDRIVYDHDTGVLAYDADGSGKGAAVTFAILDNKALLTHADFLVA
ncbi:calcium-binding protein [Methylobacterium sp. Leaf456]|uniref:calcium-binding protein n=1 Tax=Methylobacterium sp. Leaf456 TaxID=1736382 RepID=UPI000AF68CB9|nr:calcium-binding protein [Methylobacterium sp. Leaf456]